MKALCLLTLFAFLAPASASADPPSAPAAAQETTPVPASTANPEPVSEANSNRIQKFITVGSSKRTLLEQRTLPVPTRIGEYTTQDYLWIQRPTTEGRQNDDQFYWWLKEYDVRDNPGYYSIQELAVGQKRHLSHYLQAEFTTALPLCMQWCMNNGLKQMMSDCNYGDIGCICRDWYNIDPGNICSNQVCPGGSARVAQQIFQNLCSTFDYRMRNQIEDPYTPYFTRSDDKTVNRSPQTLLPSSELDLYENIGGTLVRREQLATAPVAAAEATSAFSVPVEIVTPVVTNVPAQTTEIEVVETGFFSSAPVPIDPIGIPEEMMTPDLVTPSTTMIDIPVEIIQSAVSTPTDEANILESSTLPTYSETPDQPSTTSTNIEASIEPSIALIESEVPAVVATETPSFGAGAFIPPNPIDNTTVIANDPVITGATEIPSNVTLAIGSQPAPESARSNVVLPIVSQPPPEPTPEPAPEPAPVGPLLSLPEGQFQVLEPNTMSEIAPLIEQYIVPNAEEVTNEEHVIDSSTTDVLEEAPVPEEASVVNLPQEESIGMVFINETCEETLAQGESPVTVSEQKISGNTALAVGEVPEPVETAVNTVPEDETAVMVFNGTDREVPEIVALSGAAPTELPEIIVFNETSSGTPEVVVVQNSTAGVPEVVIFDETTPGIPEVVIANTTLTRVFTTPIPDFEGEEEEEEEEEEEGEEVVVAQNPTAPIQYTPLMTPTHQTSGLVVPMAIPTHAPSVVTAQNKTRTVVGTHQIFTNNETRPGFEDATQEESSAAGRGRERIYRSLMVVGLIAVPVAMFM